MKIHEIQLEKIGPFGKEKLAFTPGLNVITGVNGSGKSLILKAVNAAVRTIPEQNSSPPPSFAAINPYWMGAASSITLRLTLPRNVNQNQEVQIRQQPQPGNRGPDQIVVGRGAVDVTLVGGIVNPYFPTRPDNGSLIYISAHRGEVLAPESAQANLQSWRSIATAQRFSTMRGLVEALRNRDGEEDLLEILGEQLKLFFMDGELVKIKRARREASGQAFKTEVQSSSRMHELISLASGCAEVLFLVLETFKAENSLIMIDEPEIHLHPRLQDLAFKYIYQLTSRGNQVIVASHSLSFIYGTDPRRVFSLLPEGSTVYAKMIVDGDKPTDAYDSALSELGYSKNAFISAVNAHKRWGKEHPDWKYFTLPDDSARGAR